MKKQESILFRWACWLTGREPEKIRGDYFLKERRHVWIGSSLILLGALASGVMLAYFFAQTIGNHWLTFVMSPIWFLVVLNLERALFTSGKVWSFVVRILFVLAISYISSLPFKMAVVKPDAVRLAQKDVKEANADRFAEAAGLEQAGQRDATEISGQIRELDGQLAEWKRLAQAELDGVKTRSNHPSIQFETSGVPSTGQNGKKFVFCMTQAEKLERQLAELREKQRSNGSLNAQKASSAREKAEQLAENDSSTTFMQELIAFEKLFERPEPEIRAAAWQIYIICYALFLLIELSCIIYKLSSGSSAYDKLLESYDQALHKAAEGVQTTFLNRVEAIGREPQGAVNSSEDWNNRAARFAQIFSEENLKADYQGFGANFTPPQPVPEQPVEPAPEPETPPVQPEKTTGRENFYEDELESEALRKQREELANEREELEREREKIKLQQKEFELKMREKFN